KFRYFLLMGLEALIYAIGLALWLSVFVNLLLQVVAAGSVAHLPTMERIALSIGAGLYEELFFRLFLVSALIYLFQLFIYKKWIIYSAAIIIAAFIFSLMHYVGALGDAFSLRSFLFRFFFGVALSVIYWWRGFAVAAWTHSLYDILVVIYG
ncbi:MAG TPA: CPBP family glutamic-type intramembrane protease, partial [Balneolaceae bacterium]|nr:CPBP family glutamic-type intramembrane protease [Balneolaceae bacterium]